jgi:hypothetical protein
MEGMEGRIINYIVQAGIIVSMPDRGASSSNSLRCATDFAPAL